MHDYGLWVGVIALLVTVASFTYAVLTARRSAREKRLAYEVLPAAPLADAVSPSSDFRVALTYQEADRDPVTVNAVFVQYLRFANFGKLPIKRDDSASADPFRVEATGGNPLSVSLVNSSREVCQFALGARERSEETLKARIEFDFMDSRDGGLIQVVSESPHTKAVLRGTIVGMPGGITRAKERQDGISFPDLGCVIPLIIEFLSIAAVPFLYRQIMGTWNNAWVLLLPIAGVFLPILVTLPVVFFLTGRQQLKFPSRLEPPRHYSARIAMYMRPGMQRIERTDELKETEEAQQDESTVPSKAAPSASSDVR